MLGRRIDLKRVPMSPPCRRLHWKLHARCAELAKSSPAWWRFETVHFLPGRLDQGGMFSSTESRGRLCARTTYWRILKTPAARTGVCTTAEPSNLKTRC